MGCGASKEDPGDSVVAVVAPGKTADDANPHKTAPAPVTGAASPSKPPESELQSKYELGKTLGS